MSRLSFSLGQKVTVSDAFDGDTSIVHTITQVQPALEKPYMLSNGSWYLETDLTAWVPPARSWEEIEGDIKGLATELRRYFDEHNESHVALKVRIAGRVHGDLKIEYMVADNDYFSNEVKGYSIRACVEELFRRKGWKKRNEPIALTYAGEEKIAS